MCVRGVKMPVDHQELDLAVRAVWGGGWSENIDACRVETRLRGGTRVGVYRDDMDTKPMAERGA